MRHQLPLMYVDAVARAGSIRKAAETLAITSTALNRRILAMEEELGVAIFERLHNGVRLTAAGELLIHHARNQMADLARIKSQIADLTGERRGHVTIACSQAMLPYFLPDQIARYRHAHPGVTFGVLLRDRAAAEQAIADMTADIALVFEPEHLFDMRVIQQIDQPVNAVFRPDHPLNQIDTLRLRDCLDYPLALPARGTGIRHLLDQAAKLQGRELKPAVESDSFEFLRFHALQENIVSFQIPLGLPAAAQSTELATRAIAEKDVPAGRLFLGQARERTLSVAAASFVQQLVETLSVYTEG